MIFARDQNQATSNALVAHITIAKIVWALLVPEPDWSDWVLPSGPVSVRGAMAAVASVIF